VAKPTAEPEGLAELWRQRLVAHRAVAGLALTPNKPGTPTAAAPVTIAEGLVLLNALRQQAPEAMDTGAEARLLRAINFINARSVYISAVVPAVPPRADPQPPAKPDAATAATYTLANTPLMRLAISWSSRSEPQERCRAVAIGEATVSATDWPADIAPGPWVLAIRPNAYYGSLGSGLGNYLRYAAAMKTVSEPGNSRGPESPVTSVSPVTSDQCTAISRGADRTFFVTTIDGVATVLLPCRGPDEAGAALAAAAKLLGVTPDARTTTPWGGVKLIRLGQRCIALQLLPAK
jgi:hypothetical protein